VQAQRAADAPAPTQLPPANVARAVERIEALVQLAHTRGSAHARLELHPAELGGVTIQLSVREDGLHAHIAADRADALPLLQRAAADLERSLSDRGIDLRGLDFGLAPDAEAGASRQDGRANERKDAFGLAKAGRAEADAEDEATSETTATRSVELPAGTLVDVRA